MKHLIELAKDVVAAEKALQDTREKIIQEIEQERVNEVVEKNGEKAFVTKGDLLKKMYKRLKVM